MAEIDTQDLGKTGFGLIPSAHNYFIEMKNTQFQLLLINRYNKKNIDSKDTEECLDG